MDNTFEKVKEHLARQLEIEEELIQPQTDVVNDLGADSLDLAELLLSIEDEFGIVITDESAHQLRTVEQIVEFVDKMLH